MAGKTDGKNPDDWAEIVAKNTFRITLIGGVLFIVASWIMTR